MRIVNCFIGPGNIRERRPILGSFHYYSFQFIPIVMNIYTQLDTITAHDVSKTKLSVLLTKLLHPVPKIDPSAQTAPDSKCLQRLIREFIQDFFFYFRNTTRKFWRISSGILQVFLNTFLTVISEISTRISSVTSPEISPGGFFFIDFSKKSANTSLRISHIISSSVYLQRYLFQKNLHDFLQEYCRGIPVRIPRGLS